MFVAAYWSQRKESKESASERMARFLGALSGLGEEFSTWFSKGRSRAAALQSPVAVDAASIARSLIPNRRDVDRQPIPDLGFRFAVWNGSRASLSATIGCWNQHVRNAVVLDVGSDDARSEDWYRTVLGEMIHAFDPDHAVVTSDSYLAKRGAGNPWEAGMFTYHRGGAIEVHPFE
ncbi:Imm52 family immunity protein [Sorangium sp. So ce426]|uniref:Imm52 family immunity protein n=1 Tax=Sorangium sp. So ce426 TaxID=3133312 RepID=UPI003F5BFA9B